MNKLKNHVTAGTLNHRWFNSKVKINLK